MALPNNRFDCYPKEIFPPSEQEKVQPLKCPVCTEAPMYNATTTGCGVALHCLCKKCVDRLHQTEDTKCPYCQNDISANDVRSNQIVQMQIFQLNVICAIGGCGWRGMLVQWEAHMNQAHPIHQPGAQAPDIPQDDYELFRVLVKDMRQVDRKVTMQVRLNMTIQEFKILFEEEHEISVSKQRFTWHGQPMDDDTKTIKDLGIYKGCTIISVTRFSGGILHDIRKMSHYNLTK